MVAVKSPASVRRRDEWCHLRGVAKLLQVWQGKLHVPGMFRAHIVADMLAGSGDIGRMFTGSEAS